MLEKNKLISITCQFSLTEKELVHLSVYKGIKFHTAANDDCFLLTEGYIYTAQQIAQQLNIADVRDIIIATRKLDMCNKGDCIRLISLNNNRDIFIYTEYALKLFEMHFKFKAA